MDHLRGENPPGVGQGSGNPRDMPLGAPSVYQRAALSGALGLPPLGGGASGSNGGMAPAPSAGAYGGLPAGMGMGRGGAGGGMPLLPGQAPPAAENGPMRNAISYLEQVQREFKGRPDVYLAFLSIMREFKEGMIDPAEVVQRVATLFEGHAGLLVEFQAFITGAIGGGGGGGGGLGIAARMGPSSGAPMPALGGAGASSGLAGRPDAQPSMQHAMAYMDRVKEAYGGQPAVYAEFLELVRASQQPGVDYRQVMLAVSRLFAASPALVQGFQQFLPEGYRNGFGGPTNPAPGPAPAGLGHQPAPPQQQRQQQQQHPPPPQQQQQQQNPPPQQQQHQQHQQQQQQQQQQQHDAHSAMRYMDAVREAFRTRPDVYQQFLEVMQGFQTQQLSIPSVIEQVCRLFEGRDDLRSGFQHFLPEGYRMPPPPPAHRGQQQQQQPNPTPQLPPQQPARTEGTGHPPHPSLGSPPTPPGPAAAVAGAGAAAGGGQAAVGEAVAFMGRVKREYAHDPRVYDRFLEVMRLYQGQDLDTPAVIEAVSELFRGNAGLLRDFSVFLPKDYAAMPAPAPASATAACGPAQRTPPMQPQQQQPHPAGNAPGGSAGGPMADFIARVRARFAHDQQRYGLFLQVLQRHEEQQARLRAGHTPPDTRAVEETAAALWALFAGHWDLLQDSLLFFPAPVQDRLRLLASQPPAGGAAPQVVAPPGQGGEGDMSMAVGFLNKIRQRFDNDPERFRTFLNILQDYETGRREPPQVLAAVTELLGGEDDLVREFTLFLPPSARGEAPAPAASASATASSSSSSHAAVPPPQAPAAPAPAPVAAAAAVAPAAASASASVPAAPTDGAGGGGGATDMNFAISFVNRVERRFAADPAKFARFLAALQDFEQDPCWGQAMVDVAAALFGDHPDLLHDFRLFLPQLQMGAAQTPAPAPLPPPPQAMQQQQQQWQQQQEGGEAKQQQQESKTVERAAATAERPQPPQQQPGAAAGAPQPPSVASEGKASSSMAAAESEGEEEEEELVIDDDELSEEGRPPSPAAPAQPAAEKAAEAAVTAESSSSAAQEEGGKAAAAEETAAEALTISSVAVEPPASRASSVVSMPLLEDGAGASEAAAAVPSEEPAPEPVAATGEAPEPSLLPPAQEDAAARVDGGAAPVQQPAAAAAEGQQEEEEQGSAPAEAATAEAAAVEAGMGVGVGAEQEEGVLSEAETEPEVVEVASSAAEPPAVAVMEDGAADATATATAASSAAEAPVAVTAPVTTAGAAAPEEEGEVAEEEEAPVAPAPAAPAAPAEPAGVAVVPAPVEATTTAPGATAADAEGASGAAGAAGLTIDTGVAPAASLKRPLDALSSSSSASSSAVHSQDKASSPSAPAEVEQQQAAAEEVVGVVDVLPPLEKRLKGAQEPGEGQQEQQQAVAAEEAGVAPSWERAAL